MVKALLKNSKYNPLTEEEWQRFFSLIDMSQVPESERQGIMDMFKHSADRNPVARRLYREQTAKFAISLTKKDEVELIAANALGLGGSGHITWLKDLEDVPSTALHEMRHIQQFEEELWASDSTREYSIIANKVCEAECAAISAEMDSENEYFDRLRDVNFYEIKRKLREQDIPYADGLTDQEKTKARNLYIYELAMEKTIAQYMALLMQEDGLETAELANSYGVDVSAYDLENISYWREAYKNQSLEASTGAHTILEAGLSDSEKKSARHMQRAMLLRYPDLQNLPFFQTGFSGSDLKKIGAYDYKNRNVSLKQETSFFEGTRKKQIERVVDGCFVITRVYRNDDKNSLFYEQKEGLMTPFEKEEIFYDRQGSALTRKKYENNSLTESGVLGEDGVMVNTYVGKESEEQVQTFEWQKDDSSDSIVDQYRFKEIGDFSYYEVVYKDGERSSYYMLEDGRYVGPAKIHSKSGESKTVWYSGRMIKDEETGELVPETIQNPHTTLRKDGFDPAEQLAQHKSYIKQLKKKEIIPEDMDVSKIYFRKDRKGILDFVCLNEVGTVSFEGSVHRGKNMMPVGSWKYYTAAGDLETTCSYDNKGVLLEKNVFLPGDDKPYQTIRTSDGKEHSITYGGNGVVMEESVYDNENGELLRAYSKHKNQVLQSISKGDETKYFSYRGDLEAITDGFLYTAYYAKRGVTDPEKLQKKITDEYLYDEEWNYLGRKIISYREDGSISSITTCDADGKGSCVYFGPDGKTKTAEGPVVVDGYSVSKEGEWAFYSEEGKKTSVLYRDNAVVYEPEKKQDPSYENDERVAQTQKSSSNASRGLRQVSDELTFAVQDEKDYSNIGTHYER